jgi:hypothetical protein
MNNNDEQTERKIFCRTKVPAALYDCEMWVSRERHEMRVHISEKSSQRYIEV